MLPLFRESDHGRVVNVSSGAGSQADEQFGLGSDNATGTGYAVAKAALHALTDRLAREEEHRADSRLRINAASCSPNTASWTLCISSHTVAMPSCSSAASRRI